jgi:hypothetical protein
VQPVVDDHEDDVSSTNTAITDTTDISSIAHSHIHMTHIS